MGEVRTEITLVNIEDQGVANRGYMPQEQVRRLTVNALVDTDVDTLIINEETREKLGLTIKSPGEPAFIGGIDKYVHIRWKDRETSCNPEVSPSGEAAILGALPLFWMDLMIHPQKREVVGADGDKQRYMARGKIRRSYG